QNTTRFLVMSKKAVRPKPGNGPCVTSFIFRVRSVPAALYKALGGFATNKVNITKLESYIVDPFFTAAQFYVDVDGHIDDEPMRFALEELRFFTTDLNILGVYPAHPFRRLGQAAKGTVKRSGRKGAQ
ncbi:MAG: prephenate dehydratase, partial [Rhodospirillaceae bacterium]|nr:prephenate dehydratase [Rhodospirillaceae bacterium]